MPTVKHSYFLPAEYAALHGKLKQQARGKKAVIVWGQLYDFTSARWALHSASAPEKISVWSDEKRRTFERLVRKGKADIIFVVTKDNYKGHFTPSFAEEDFCAYIASTGKYSEPPTRWTGKEFIVKTYQRK